MGKIILLADVSKHNNKYKIERLYDSVTKIQGLIVLPIYPWGARFDYMFVYTNNESLSSFKDVSLELMKSSLKHQSNIISNVLNKSKQPVYWGLTDTLSMMSVPWPHIHISQPNLNLSIEKIYEYRNETIWDYDVSKYVSEIATEYLEPKVKRFWKSATIKNDNLGFIIHLPNFTPEDMYTDNFVNNFWRPLSGIVNSVLTRIGNSFWKSDMDKAISYIIKARSGKCQFDEAYYSNFFSKQSKGIDAISNKLYHLSKHYTLRKPAAWASVLRFDPDCGASLFSIFSFLEELVGPFEGIGIKLAEADKGMVRNIYPEELNEIVFCAKHYKPKYPQPVTSESIGNFRSQFTSL
jgi:hypothetical protein